MYASATKPTHSAKYWAARTRHFDFSEEDKVDSATYNRVLWAGLMGSRPYPTERSGVDLSNAHAAGMKEASQH